MPELPTISADAALDPVWDAIDEFGGVILEGFIAPRLLGQIHDEVAPFVSKHPPGTTNQTDLWIQFHGETTKRITGLAQKSPGWVELMCDERYIAMGDHYLGENNYYLNTAQLICIGPGETPQMLHRDELNWPRATSADRETTVTAIFALTDFTEENGATVIAPGSHRLPGGLPEIPWEDTCRAVMSAGSALFYNGKVLHGGGPNSTRDEWRVGLHAGFVLGWLRSEENHQLTTSIDAARDFPEKAQQLLGFRSYDQEFGGRLGLVDYDDAALLLERSESQ